MMKRCPECYVVYEANQNYCEVDGQVLLGDPTLSVAAPEQLEPVIADSRNAWFTGIVGLMAGILICVGFYVVYSLLTIQRASNGDDSPVTEPVDRVSTRQDRRPAPSNNDTEAESTEVASEAGDAEEATDEPVAPELSTTNDSKVAARLNRGPVSTGTRDKDENEDETVRTVIEMNDGSETNVDAAWQDGKGVWYRRGGVVSFIESSRVKAITARAEPKSSP